MSRAPTSLRFTQRLTVPFDFPVIFTRRLFAPGNPALADALNRRQEGRRHRVLVCIDSGVRAALPGLERQVDRYFRAQADTLELAGPVEWVSGGERAKSDLATAQRVIRWIHDRRLCRQSFVVVVGGGSVLDVVGFAASLVHRGLRVVRVPTTVAGQNDVGVGVKTGIDAFDSKNFLGTFAPPFAVLNDLDFLDALPAREWFAGISEAFKVAMIKDRAFFRFLCTNAGRLRNRDRAAMERLVIRCARLHMDHIRAGGDPFETGSARPLDFGHWSAHCLEVLSRYRLRHGEAVSIGVALDSFYAMRQGLIAPRDLNALLAGLTACGLPIWHPTLGSRLPDGTLAVLRGLEDFREHLGGALTVTLPGPVGRRVEVNTMNSVIIEEGIRFLHTAARRLRRK